MLRARDIMTTEVYAVEADASALEAAWGLTRRHIGGAPVHDHKGALVGVLTKGDLVNPEPSQWIKGEATVADLMNPDVLTVLADDPAMLVAIGMVQRKIHQVIVMDDNLHMVGIVSAFDIVRAVTEGRDFTMPPSEG